MSYTDLTCPYCDVDQVVDHSDGQGYEEDTLHQQTCKSCEKDFIFETTVSYTYETKVADCLNDKEHDYKPTISWPIECTRLRCTIGGDTRFPTEQELNSIISK